MRRRGFLVATGATVAAGALPALGLAQATRFQPAQDITPLLRQLTDGYAVENGGIAVELPQIAENGNSVPLRVKVESPMTAGDHVKALHVIAERNPRPLVATFHLGPGNGRAEVSTRIRLAGTQKLTVLAALSGNRYRMAQVDVLVTSAACLDESM